MLFLPHRASEAYCKSPKHRHVIIYYEALLLLMPVTRESDFGKLGKS